MSIVPEIVPPSRPLPQFARNEVAPLPEWCFARVSPCAAEMRPEDAAQLEQAVVLLNSVRARCWKLSQQPLGKWRGVAAVVAQADELCGLLSGILGRWAHLEAREMRACRAETARNFAAAEARRKRQEDAEFAGAEAQLATYERFQEERFGFV